MLAFIHIPKTAGTTLHKIIAHQHSPGRVWIHHDTDGPATKELVEVLRNRRVEVIMGHMSVGFHEFLPEVRYITCLREPMARLISHYRHALSDPAHYLHDAVVNDRLDLAGYITSGLSGELTDGMTRMLAGVEDFHHGKVDATTLAKAKDNLEKWFDAVIFSEDFDRGSLELAKRYGWSTPYYMRRKVGQHLPVPGKPVKEQWNSVREHNQHDIELYQWARERFGAQATHPHEEEAQVQKFQSDNRRVGKIWFCLREVRLRMTRQLPSEHEGMTSEFHTITAK